MEVRERERERKKTSASTDDEKRKKKPKKTKERNPLLFSPWCRRYRWSKGPVDASGSIGTTIRFGHTTIDVSVVRMNGSSQSRMALAE